MAVSGEGTAIYLTWQPPPPTGKNAANESVGDSAAFSSSSFLPVVGDRDELGKMKGGSRSKRREEKRREEGDSTAFSSSSFSPVARGKVVLEKAKDSGVLGHSSSSFSSFATGNGELEKRSGGVNLEKRSGAVY
ncbi:unnamed protein product [Linum trigynum]|uniref:Uncharacterized protein n=1 Tax=Linum trigynum TaxID=586398 RepID=A0AAV2CL40_9ROSI